MAKQVMNIIALIALSLVLGVALNFVRSRTAVFPEERFKKDIIPVGSRKFRIIMDSAAFFFIAFLFFISFWCRNPVIQDQQFLYKMPIQFKLFYADIVLFVPSLYWLICRVKKLNGKALIYNRTMQALLIASPFIPLLAYFVTLINN